MLGEVMAGYSLFNVFGILRVTMTPHPAQILTGEIVLHRLLRAYLLVHRYIVIVYCTVEPIFYRR